MSSARRAHRARGRRRRRADRTRRSGSSSKPRTADPHQPRDSIKNLPSVTSSSGVSGLKSQMNTIVTDANSVVNSASATSQSDQRRRDVRRRASNRRQALPSSPSASRSSSLDSSPSVVTSVPSFSDVTESRCRLTQVRDRGPSARGRPWCRAFRVGGAESVFRVGEMTWRKTRQTIERRMNRFLSEPASVRNAASVIVTATVVVVVAGESRSG